MKGKTYMLKDESVLFICTGIPVSFGKTHLNGTVLQSINENYKPGDCKMFNLFDIEPVYVGFTIKQLS